MSTGTAQQAPAALAVIGAAIREAREDAGMTQDELAKALGVTQTAVSYWEAAKRDLGVTDLLRIADALEIPAASLLPDEHQELCAPPPGGQFMEVSFLGHDNRVGYVTDVTVGGEPGFRIDLPDKVFGGNPLSWEEWSGKALRMRRPVPEAGARKAWEKAREAAARRARDEAEWRRRMQEQRALEAGNGDDSEEDVAGEDDDVRDGRGF